jgi:hypothetical protein
LTKRRVRLAVGLVIAAWVIAAGVVILLVRSQALAGRDAADKARTEASPEDLVAARPLGDLRRAGARMRSAHRTLRNPIISPLRVLPVIGRQLRAADALTTAGAQVAGVGADAVAQAQGALLLPHKTGAERVVILRRLATIAEDAKRRLTGVDYGRGDALVGPVRSARVSLIDQLAKVRDGLGKGIAGARAAADLLDGPRHYLVLAANNAEMRVGTGMFLSVGLLETQTGKLHLDSFRPAADLDLGPFTKPPPADPDLLARWGFLHIDRNWRNLAMSPRFDAVAPLAAGMWVAAGNAPVDGVIALDPLALRAVLKATGPIQAGTRTVDADHVVDYLLHDQYVDFAAKPDDPSRNEQLGRVAQAALQALQDREWSVSSLAKEIAGAVRGRHVLAWSTLPAENDAWRNAGVDGSMRPASLLVAVANRGANKLDRFLDVSVDMTVKKAGDRRDVVLTVHLANRTPAQGEPRYVVGPDPGGGAPEGVYRGILSISLPTPVHGGRFDAVPSLVAFGPDGPSNVVAVAFDLTRGAARDFVMRFSVPKGPMRIEPSAREPAVRWRVGASQRDDAAGFTLAL